MKILAMVAVTSGIGLASAQVTHPLNPPSATSALLPASATAFGASSTTASNQNETPPTLTNADLSTFFDGLVPFALQRGDVAGAVISVVKDGKIIFARGYGYADLKTRARPSPETTLFRPGSTSKLFTWTAVMQLVEQGKLNLDRDVNDYLDFKIPPRDGKPITLRDVMTHTPGFEDTARGLITGGTRQPSLGEYLKTHLPARIFPPGEIVAYSNYGCGLAGYIVQRVSGQRFDDYIQQDIFAPLDMLHSTFEQPPPASWGSLMASSYRTASDGQPQPFEVVNPEPAGGLSSTATDMAHFMIAQLQGGSYNGEQILEPATVALMHSPQHTAAPGLNGFDLGFYQEDSHGQRIIGHAGDLDYFHSDLHLMLGAHVGFFISMNSAGNEGGAGVIRAALFRAFLDHYFPYQVPSQPTVSSARADAARVAGWYEASRRNDSAMRPLYLLGQVNVAAQPDDSITVAGLTNDAGVPLQWHEVGPLSYREVNGTGKLKFVTNAQGAIRYWATDVEPPVFVFQPVSGLRSLGSVRWLMTLACLIVLVALLSWPLGWGVRRHYRQRLELSLAQKRTRSLSRLGTLTLFIVVLGWLVLLMVLTATDAIPLVHGTITPWLYVLYVLGVLGLIGALAVVVHAVRTWIFPRRSRWVLCGETLLALAAIYLAWFILAFGLVSFSARY
ncbi:MAG: serine hydrolase domain-containing protein [Rhodanobacter sp.]